MSNINRSDVFVRSEAGPSWFQEFLESYANNKESSTQDIMDIIQNKRSETVQGVVDKYREMVGLDSLANSEEFTKNAEKLKKHKDQVPGGLADKKFPKDFDSKQIEKGIKVELEHTNDENLAREISMDHLTEDPEYYDKLEKMESEMEDKKAMKISKRCIAMEQPDVVLIIEKDPKIKNDIESLCRHSGGTKDTHAIINFIREKLGKDLVSYSNKDLVQYVEDTKSKYKEHIEEPNTDAGAVGTENTDYVDETADYITHGKGS